MCNRCKHKECKKGFGYFDCIVSCKICCDEAGERILQAELANAPFVEVARLLAKYQYED